MEYEKMVLLIRAVDDLLKLNEALINLNRMGYQENFPQLDNIYEVIKSVSIYKNCDDDDSIEEFYSIVEEISETVEKRAKILMNIQ